MDFLYKLKDKRIYLSTFFAILIIVTGFTISAPRDFPKNSIITVPEGIGLLSLSKTLEEQGVIRSPFWFRVTSIVLRGERNMKAGSYYLDRPESSLTIARRVFRGDHRVESVKITIPEGFTTEEISALFDERFVFFDNTAFEFSAPQGYLFPDTYFVPLTATASSTIKLMRDNFERKVAPLDEEVKLFGKSFEEVLVMASLLEGELKSREEREIASGILWKRLKIGMALQVDSAKGTYEYRGLPERPINNPGIVSIESAIRPVTTQYMYFLTGKDGKTHYAKTFDEHKANIVKYLTR